jgi:hypothetical protein
MKKEKIFLPILLKTLCSAYTQYTQNNPISPNNGLIQKIFFAKP